MSRTLSVGGGRWSLAKQGAKSAVAYAVDHAFKRYLNGSPKFAAKSTASVNSPSIGITRAYDQGISYRRRRLTRRGRRRLRRKVRFTRSVVRAEDSRYAHQKVLFVQTGTASSVANGQIMVCDPFNLYGMTSPQPGVRDVSQILTALGDTSTSLTNSYVKSGRSDISILNTGQGGLYIECYYWIARKDMPSSFVSIAGIIAGGFTETPTNMGGTSLTSTTYGALPYQCLQFSQFCKVYKTTVHLLAEGATLDLVLKARNNRLLNSGAVNDYAIKKGLTRGIVMVIYGQPNLATDATAGQATPASINYNVTRTYTVSSNRPGLVDVGTTQLTP